MLYAARVTNRRTVGGAVLALLVLAWASASCARSASETPWPVPPDNAETDPRGEQLDNGNVVDTDKLPDNYSHDAGAKAPPQNPAAEGIGGAAARREELLF